MLPEEIYPYFLSHPTITTDSRNVPPGCIYWALKGERFDGNLFAAAALEAGAAYAVVDNPDIIPEGHAGYLFVTDTLAALQALANYHRRALDIPVIAIGGSNGKTTTKELLAAALSNKMKVLATPGNLNNHIGLPLTLLRIRKDFHQVAVIELGANHLFENETLCKIAEPTHAIITNTGKDHLEGFGGVEGVIKANQEIIESLRYADGVWIRNLDDEALAGESYANSIGYSMQNAEGAAWTGTLTARFPFVEMEIAEASTGVKYAVQTQLAGGYNAHNILAAAAACHAIGVDINEVVRAAAEYIPANNRSQRKEAGGNTYILDAYNANPSSMALAVGEFNTLPVENKVLILGDMFELGEAAAEEHKAILDLIQADEYRLVLLAGSAFGSWANSYPFRFFPTTEALIDEWKQLCLQGCTVLLKGSRGMAMERVVSPA